MATANDRAVLQSIFHPNTPFGEISAELEEVQEEDGAGAAFDPELLEQATELEIQGVAAAEAGDLDKALERFDRAIRLLPERATAYNNRAQALRLNGDVASARKDLDMTLKLSKGVGRVACQGFVQRGLIQRLQGQEEAARKDFEQAASLGSTFARQQLVLMNPYAALCNQMLSEVVKKLHCPREEPQQEASSREKECH
ncbi:tetratricopeptide repeat protein 36 isoform X1 [Rhineura floridana]|uniref:tetratricopeptide repeat protein 36 isoform X1 n=1 Tax=Rhineura floridana TaxID=261503 RepID=UPI002AC854E3|nr:tetratricopeptide repeat protein 36 isoform X1 [Rhineura floridana]